ncbi:D-2-hydroxyacid dehydrogenase [Anaerolentibacter hominis]|uniref:D-2-hydroxyacid dehydrogenase n=1 Tax=Anaerolentibacter hominis TaxID=3079009 RepID=UPI0031B7FF0A
MRKVLVVMPVQERHKELLEKQAPGAEFIYCDPKDVTPQLLEDVNILVGNVAPSLLKNAANLELVQLNSAGTNGYTEPGVLPADAVLNNATGAYGLAIAEHMLGEVLVLQKKLNRYQENQKNHLWKDEGPVAGIYGSTTVIVGLGDIGGEFARRMKALGSYVIGVVRTERQAPEYVDELYTNEDLDEVLGRADIVATSLPGTDATYRIFDKNRFETMKKGCLFLNVGRGTSVDTDALVEALNSGHLGGAAVDVTDPEPLPEDHPLWNAKNVLITPHISGGYHMQETWERIVLIAAANIRALYEGTPYHTPVDMKTGYKKK